MNILIDIIPSSARRYVYATYAAIGLVIGTLALTPAAIPEWVATAYAFVGGALGLTAYANTHRSLDDLDWDDDTPGGE